MRNRSVVCRARVRPVLFVLLVVLLLTGASITARAEEPVNGAPVAPSAPAYMQSQRLMEDDGYAEDLFGGDVAWDGTTLVVGVPSHDSGSDTNKGAVEIYRWDGSHLGAPVELTPPEDTDDFGRAVAVQGNTVAVSAKSRERTGEDLLPFYQAYTVYIYVFDGTTWVQEAMLWSQDANAPINNFGYDVALAGDTLAVGAPDAVAGGKNRQGTVHVFTRTQGIWTRQVILTPSDGSAQQYFGRAVALEGNRLMVGTSPLLSIPAAVYYFERVGDSWTERQIIADPNPQGNRFGSTLALAGDTVVIGDWLDLTNGSQDSHSGTAYAFTRTNGSWIYQAKLGTGVNLEFGRSLALAGEMLVVGAPAVRGIGSGAAHLFLHSDGNWLYRGQIDPADPSVDDDRFAEAVAMTGDTVLVGAPHKSTSDGKWLGAVYVYTTSPTGDSLFLPVVRR